MLASVVSGNTEKPNPAEYPIIARVNGSTVHLYLADKPAVTILYDPGCSGLDNWGKSYQAFHIESFKKIWPEANLIVSQYVNDITKGSTNGRCDWPGTDARLKDKQSWAQAVHTQNVAEWAKAQSWSNGVVHLFGFSWGGRVGIWVPASKYGRPGTFASVALVWPDCRPSDKIQAGTIHTPTRIWATENDPLSIPKNCPNYYQDPDNKLTLSLFPGETHSWFDGPFFKPYTRFWPVQKVYVRHEYNADWTSQTFQEWRAWAARN